jgi:DNA-binding XRE family transcriptional regulator
MQTTSFNEVLDMHIGKHGTKKREKFEQELRIELLGDAIKKARKAKNLTQEQLGELVGVQKAQISKVENSATDARFATILKVFDALDAKVKFSVEIDEQKLMISNRKGWIITMVMMINSLSLHPSHSLKC